MLLSNSLTLNLQSKPFRLLIQTLLSKWKQPSSPFQFGAQLAIIMVVIIGLETRPKVKDGLFLVHRWLAAVSSGWSLIQPCALQSLLEKDYPLSLLGLIQFNLKQFFALDLRRSPSLQSGDLVAHLHSLLALWEHAVSSNQIRGRLIRLISFRNNCSWSRYSLHLVGLVLIINYWWKQGKYSCNRWSAIA